jgi:hypothetical protein
VFIKEPIHHGKMKKTSLLIILFFSFPFSLQALDLSDGSLLNKNENKISFKAGMIFGLISPPNTFSHPAGLNSAQVFEQKLTFTHGLGTFSFLQDVYFEVETLTYQSREETVNGSVVHESDTGFALTLRAGGNFIHNRKFIFGPWLQLALPLFMDKDKFVNPVINYLGAGLKGVYSLTPELGVSQSVFVGSGLFEPVKRNPNFRSATLGIFNFGKLWFDHDVVISSGLVLETDLQSRQDAAYQSALGNGTINNLVFIIPVFLDVALGKDWNLNLGHAMKYRGKSVRGSQFSQIGLSKKF